MSVQGAHMHLRLHGEGATGSDPQQVLQGPVPVSRPLHSADLRQAMLPYRAVFAPGEPSRGWAGEVRLCTGEKAPAARPSYVLPAV